MYDVASPAIRSARSCSPSNGSSIAKKPNPIRPPPARMQFSSFALSRDP
jgi:hypothetical protein